MAKRLTKHLLESAMLVTQPLGKPICTATQLINESSNGGARSTSWHELTGGKCAKDVNCHGMGIAAYSPGHYLDYQVEENS